MSARLVLRLTAPLIAVSGLLLALGVGAAWHVHRLQKEASASLAHNVQAMKVADDLATGIREVRTSLGAFLYSSDRRYLQNVIPLHHKNRELLEQAAALAVVPRQKQLIAEVAEKYESLLDEFNHLSTDLSDESDKERVQIMIDAHITEEILDPVQEYVEINQDLVTATSLGNERAINEMGLVLTLLGACGAGAGLLAGFAVARAISRSLVQLSVPIHDAAGKLNQVVGPIRLSAGQGIEELERALQKMAGDVGTVVERLEQSRRDALRAEQLAAVGQMAAGLAHEIRNPLMAMKLLVQSAAAQGQAGSLRGRDLAVLDEEIRRQERSLQSFLDFARPPQLEPRPFDARSLVGPTLELVRVRAERQRVHLTAEMAESPLTILGDAEQVRQVLLNLLLNALDALPSGGEATLTMHQAASGTWTGTGLNASADGDLVPPGWLEIRVTDNGPGLPAELADRIFEPFISTKETGVGLGLSICRRIVEAHGGRITAHDSPQGGAVFSVLLPLAAEPAPALALVSPASTPA